MTHPIFSVNLNRCVTEDGSINLSCEADSGRLPLRCCCRDDARRSLLRIETAPRCVAPRLQPPASAAAYGSPHWWSPASAYARMTQHWSPLAFVQLLHIHAQYSTFSRCGVAPAPHGHPLIFCAAMADAASAAAAAVAAAPRLGCVHQQHKADAAALHWGARMPAAVIS